MLVSVFFQLLGIVIIGLAIGGLSHAQLLFSKHMFIVIIVLVVLAYLLAIFSFCLQKKRGKNNYDVNDACGKRSLEIKNILPSYYSCIQIGFCEW